MEWAIGCVRCVFSKARFEGCWRDDTSASFARLAVLAKRRGWPVRSRGGKDRRRVRAAQFPASSEGGRVAVLSGGVRWVPVAGSD